MDSGLYRQVKEALDPSEWSKVEPLLERAWRSPVIPSMPFPDAIALAKFLVQVTAQYSHFLFGPDTVGGMVKIAGINRHEGFRWVNRKHYYPAELNPWGSGHDE